MKCSTCDNDARYSFGDGTSSCAECIPLQSNPVPHIKKMKAEIAELTEKLAAAETSNAKERQAGRDELLDDISDALQSDLENGVKWLNETASKEFREKYPALNKALCQTELKGNV